MQKLEKLDGYQMIATRKLGPIARMLTSQIGSMQSLPGEIDQHT